MEHIAGETLANCGILSEYEALHYMEPIGEALAWVHQNRLLHRDVRLQNIMVRDRQSEAVLTEILHHSQVRPKASLELKFKAHSPSPFQWTKLLTQSYEDECELLAVGFKWGSSFAHVQIGRMSAFMSVKDSRDFKSTFYYDP